MFEFCLLLLFNSYRMLQDLPTLPGNLLVYRFIHKAFRFSSSVFSSLSAHKVCKKRDTGSPISQFIQLLHFFPSCIVDWNDLKRYKFDHNFDDTIDPMCSANDGVDDVTHFLLSCQLYGHIRIELLNTRFFIYNQLDSVRDLKIA